MPERVHPDPKTLLALDPTEIDITAGTIPARKMPSGG
jgi:hypothetical protein